ncbi:hypothetical protein [Rhabdothermincola salaria]|uniref:hypothetical protein n=1 Tax=Rhabdothermincola salaria TaxID=2903142 RepID=UPI001E62969B|nr:hypothetical protein [Rhabdothermincola salaria]MCD9624604.1 hypothetical protein [Rhabdothermincola salaria]
MSVVIIVLVLVVVIPVGFLVTMSLVAALLGWATKTEVDDLYTGTEDLELSNRS